MDSTMLEQVQMRTFRFLMMGLVGLVVTFGSLSLMSGCGDDSNTTGTQVKETEAAKKENQRLQDAMRDAMLKKGAMKTPKK
jgi:multisubunit Na+/H+ antiporter MnhB subunit